MSKVVAVRFDGDAQACFGRAIKLVKIDDLNRKGRPVVVKVGVFSKSSGVHTSVGVINALSNAFNKTPMIYLAESDNYSGPATSRLLHVMVVSAVFERINDLRGICYTDYFARSGHGEGRIENRVEPERRGHPWFGDRRGFWCCVWWPDQF